MEERAGRGHGFRSLARARHGAWSVVGEPPPPLRTPNRATFFERAWRGWVQELRDSAASAEQLVRGPKCFGFLVKDLLKCHSLRRWISVTVAPVRTQVKRGEMRTGGFIGMCMYQLFK